MRDTGAGSPEPRGTGARPMTSKRAGEIMIPLDRFPHIPYWFTLRQAMAELSGVGPDQTLRCPCGIVLVFSAQNQLLGMLRAQDILGGLRPRLTSSAAENRADRAFDVAVDPNLFRFYEYERSVGKLPEQIERPVMEFMQPLTTTVAVDDDLLQTAYLMIHEGLDQVPVLQDNRIVGLVSALDALRHIARLVV
ncbi:MAG: CBS domain-containing protein [Deltaproteobacteria bacterium]|nr:CBS domain-containing protein [Deltaproteobacteria bacterium]